MNIRLEVPFDMSATERARIIAEAINDLAWRDNHRGDDDPRLQNLENEVGRAMCIARLLQRLDIDVLGDTKKASEALGILTED